MVQQKTQLGSQIAYIYHMSKAKEARGDNSREISCLVLRGESCLELDRASFLNLMIIEACLTIYQTKFSCNCIRLIA